ncbi:hypothetical protein HNP24_001808 [Chryseobacterium sediminis]|uniref:Uncharacterized protein n=1 Tax=Chryseobacterium sediminis TaxID=1679494 RepID=A0ABR6Q178_9FLAO|nr:hypothetical protein [Chryseobacterium sediminis]MBB6330858.1 hypothetical protein [Chryseobacterium sediminis]
MKNLFFLSLILIASSSLQAQSNSVEIWMRAFIPNPQNAAGGSGYINAIPAGGSSISLHNINPAIPNMCYATDDRGFSTDNNATSRLETKFILTLNQDGTGTVSPSSNRTVASLTKKLDCTTGAVLDQKIGSVDKDYIGTPAVADGTVQVLGQVQGRNLLTPAGSQSPSIDYSFDIKWTPSTTTLTVKTTIGSFPAFELYARQPNGKWVAVVQQLPSGTPWALGGDSFGINSTLIIETKKVSGIKGIFKTPSPEQRFTLEIQDKTVKWTEKNSSGVTLTKEATIRELPDGKFRIERPNTEDVLTFLGFQPSLRAEILAKGPEPSFIIFYRNNEKMIAEWNGLIATKDANAHLKELIQPGVRPAKIYDLLETP